MQHRKISRIKANMFLQKACFVVTAALLLVMNTKAQLENDPFCNTEPGGFRFKSSLHCYNYENLPTNLENPTEVKEIWIESKKLETLEHGAFRQSKLINLEVLILSGSAIKTIEVGALYGANKITELHLLWNQIEAIDLHVFQHLPNLEELHLGDNPLHLFLGDAEFPKLNLTFLTFTGCRLTSIPLNLFRNLEKLKWLDLSYNQLQVLDWKVFLPLKSLIEVELMENPFQCDCQVKFILDFLDMKNVTWDTLPVSCKRSSTTLNKKLIGVQWKKIDRHLLICPPEIHSIRICKPHNVQTVNGTRIGEIAVECKYEGYPEPHVTWTKDDGFVHFEESVTIQTEKIGDINPDFNTNYKQAIIFPSSSAFYGSYKCQIGHDVAEINVDGIGLPGYSLKNNVSSTTEFISYWTAIGTCYQVTPKKNSSQASPKLLTVVLAVILVLLLIVIAASGIYIGHRYLRMKRKALPKKVCSTIPRELNSNRVPQTVTIVEDPTYPPLLGGLENVPGSSNEQ